MLDNSFVPCQRLYIIPPWYPKTVLGDEHVGTKAPLHLTHTVQVVKRGIRDLRRGCLTHLGDSRKAPFKGSALGAGLEEEKRRVGCARGGRVG